MNGNSQKVILVSLLAAALFACNSSSKTGRNSNNSEYLAKEDDGKKNTSPVSIPNNSDASLESTYGEGTDPTGSGVEAEKPIDYPLNSPVNEKSIALAVRGGACFMCHAKIKGDVVTDFGAFDDFYMGDHPEFPRDANNGSKYSFWGKESWQTAKIRGNLYIPNLQVISGEILNLFGVQEMKLFDFMTESYNHYDGTAMDPLVSVFDAADSNGKTYDELDPGVYGQIIARDNIYIGTPRRSQIEALPNAVGAKQIINSEAVKVYATKGSSLQGAKNLENHLLVGNGVACRGDIIVLGTVFFDDASISITGNGCRFYVDKAVFVRGPIRSIGAAMANTQISSATAIIMGMSSFDRRMDHFSGTRQENKKTLGDDLLRKLNEQSQALNLTEDAGPIGVVKNVSDDQVTAYLESGDPTSAARGAWKDLSGATPGFDPLTACDWGKTASSNAGKNCYRDWAGAYNRKTFDQNHLLLHSQVVYSRYGGTFRGTIIGEDVLFAPKQFTLEYDSRFSNVPILPLLGADAIRLGK